MAHGTPAFFSTLGASRPGVPAIVAAGTTGTVEESSRNIIPPGFAFFKSGPMAFGPFGSGARTILHWTCSHRGLDLGAKGN